MECKYKIRNKEKNNSKNSRDSVNKNNISCNHNKKNTEINLYEGNQRFRNKINIKNSSDIISSNSSNYNYSYQNINKNKNITSKQLVPTSYSTADIFSQTKKINNNIKNNKFQNLKQQSVNTQQKGKYYLDYLNKKRNTIGCEDRDYSGKRNKFNNSDNQKFNKIGFLESQKNYNLTDIKKSNNQKKECNDLNKIIIKERKKILNKINTSKLNKDFLTEAYNMAESKKYNDNPNMKITNHNFYFSSNNNCSIKMDNNNNNKRKLNNTSNLKLSSSKNSKKKSNKNTLFGQYYLDIDLSLNNNNISNNKKINKQSSYLESSYNSPTEKNKKINNNNSIDLRNNKKNNLTSREKNTNALSNISKKIDYNRNQNNTKYKYIPYNGNKVINYNKNSNDYQREYLSNYNFNVNSGKMNDLNLLGSNLNNDNKFSKKEININKENKTMKDNINNQKLNKSNEQTPKNKIKSLEYDLNYNAGQISMNYNKLNNKYQTENRLKKNNKNNNNFYNNININNKSNKCKNKKNLVNYQSVYLTKNEKPKENYFEVYNSIELDDSKIPLINKSKKNSKISNKNSEDKKLNLTDFYNNTKESINQIESKQKRKNINLNVKDNHFKEPNANQVNNCLNYNFNNMAYVTSKNTNKNDNGMQIIISNNASGRKKISLSPTTTIYHNKFNIIQFNGNNINNNNKINNNKEININTKVLNSENNINNNSKKISDYNRNNRINYLTECNNKINNELISGFNKNINENKNDEYISMIKNNFIKQIKNNTIKVYPNNHVFYNSTNIKSLNQNQNNNIKNYNNLYRTQKLNNANENKQTNKNNNNINYKTNKNNKNNNIININNSNSTVSVLNVKNSSINICIEKNNRYKELSDEKNIAYSSNLNHSLKNSKNKKNNVKYVAKELLEKNNEQKNIRLKQYIYKNNYLKEDNSPNFIRISTNTIRTNNNLNLNRNENKSNINNKNGINNQKHNSHLLVTNNSEIHLFKNTKYNREFSENNVKINMNNYEDKFQKNSNKMKLNNQRNIFSLSNHDNLSKPIKIPIKENNINKNINYNKVINKNKGINNNKNGSKNNCNIIDNNNIKNNSNIIDNNNIKNNSNIFDNNNIKNNSNIIDNSNIKNNSNIFDNNNIKNNSNIIDISNNSKKIYLPVVSTCNSNRFQTRKFVYDGIYIKPTCILSRSNSKNNKTQSKIKLKNYIYNDKNNNSIKINNNFKEYQKSLNTSASNINLFKNKLSFSLNISQTKLKNYHSQKDLNDTSIEKNQSEKNQKTINFNNLSEDSLDIKKIRDIYAKSYSFIYKYYNYYIKLPKINNCYLNKNYIINKKLNKEIDIKLNLLNKINNDENLDNKNNNNKIINLQIEEENKDEILNNNDNINKKNISYVKINNEDEKINESSQNGLIVTFGEVNYNRKNSATINYKNNDIISQYNNDIVNDESDLDIYKKLDIIQQESQNKVEDNISENEDLKFNFSDEADSHHGTNCINPLFNSNKINDYHFHVSTNGKEIEDTDEKVCKTYKKNILDCKYNLENAKKGLRILKKLAIRRGYKSDDEKKIKKINNIKEKREIYKNLNKKNEKIYLGTNKLNEIFNNKKEIENSDYYDNDSFEKDYKNICSRSVNKDIVKGISKIENLFEKKYFNNEFNSSNNSHKINYNDRYKKNNKINDCSNDNCCIIDNVLDYNDEFKPKIRTYIQKMKNHLYYQNSKNEKEASNLLDEINNNINEDIRSINNNNNSIPQFNEEINKNNIENNLKDIGIQVSNEDKSSTERTGMFNQNVIKNDEIKNKYSLDFIISYKNNKYSLKQNLLTQESNNHCNELLCYSEEYSDDNDSEESEENSYRRNLTDQSFHNNIEKKINIQKNNENISDEEIIPLEKESTTYLYIMKKNQSKNRIKYEIINLLNIITEECYYNIFNKIADIILYDNNDKDIFSTERLNNNENILKNEHIFKDIILKKGTSEMKFTFIYAELCYDLDIKINSILIEQRNTKNSKEKKFKYIINDECINLLNKYKDNSKDIINITDKESDEYILLKKNIIGYVSFVYELINKKVLKQQFGYNILEQFYKKYIDNDLNDIIKFLYLESCIILLKKLGKLIFERNNQKYIGNLNNYINNNLSNIINNNINIPSYLKYRIINIIKRNENLWQDSASEILKKEKNIVLGDSDSEDIEINNKEIISFEDSYKKSKNSKIKDEYKPRDENELMIEEDLLNYISFFTEKSPNGQVNIKNNVDKSYNWKIIDELINEKNIGLEYIIDEFIQICTYTIHDENQLIISNDYIKNIIEYYSANLQKDAIDLIHTEMIKTFLIIDEFINNNIYMPKILGNLLFLLIDNRLYHIKYFNKYLKAEKQTQINLAIITKYCIISSGKFAKKYFNDFKQTKLFNNNDIFKKHVKEELKDLFYFIK